MALSGEDVLLSPSNCMLVLTDQQAGLAFGVQSIDHQVLVNNSVSLARTAVAFGLPIVASTSASKVYSGPMIAPLQAVLPAVVPIERRNMNAWEDETCHNAILGAGRKRILVSGMLTEACVAFLVLSALAEGFDVFVVGDACGGASVTGHELALRRMTAAGAAMTSWLQVLLELQRDWTRHETYDEARAIVETNGGGYGLGLAYARTMIKPAQSPPAVSL
jgi:nicotinamidase-related amidase